MDVPARAESSPGVTSLEDEHRQLVRQTVTYINQVAGEMMLRAYQIGAYVWETILGKGRAPYGQHLVQQIASHPSLQMSRSTLFNCISLARAYPELGKGEIPGRLKGLSLSHLYILSRVEGEEDRRWFEQKAIKKRWSVRRLEQYCVMREYHRPEAQEDDGTSSGKATEQADRVSLEPGVYSPDELMEELRQIGPASFKVLSPRKRKKSWDALFVNCGMAKIRPEDLCLLRAFVEVAEATGSSAVEIKHEDGAVLAAGEGMSLAIESR